MTMSRLRLTFAAGMLLSVGSGTILAGGNDEQAPAADVAAAEQVAAPVPAGSLATRLLVGSYLLAGRTVSGSCSFVREHALSGAMAVVGYFLFHVT